MKLNFLRLSLLSMLVMLCGVGAWAGDPVTAKWDFTSSANPRAETLLQGTTGTLASNVDGVELTIDASNGKFDSKGRTSDAHIPATTIIKVPVHSTKDQVTIVGNWKVSYTIGLEAEAVTDLNKTYTATAADVTAGFVTITSTDDNNYFYSITVVLNEPEEGSGNESALSGPIFSANVIATAAQSFSTGTTEITSSQATIVGGKMYAVSAQTNAKTLIAAQGSTFYFCMTNNNTYFKVELDNAIAVGDVITANALGGTKSNLEKGLWVTTSESYPSSAPACAGTSATESIVTNILNYTVTEGSEYVGKKTLYIYRAAGATEYFGNFVITRPASESGEEGGGTEPAVDILATWDFVNNCANLDTKANGGAFTAETMASDKEGISMTIVYNGGQIKNNDNSYLIGTGVEMRIPVKNKGDVVTVEGYPNYFHYSVAGVVATERVTTYDATAADVAQGYVSIVATESNNYINLISVLQKAPSQSADLVEKSIYKTDFSDWSELTASKEETPVQKTTKYSKENLTFTFYNMGVNTGTYDESKFPNNNGYRIFCDKNAGGYITTSALANVTKVRFVHAATGSNRGYKLEAKGEGDTDWVVISESAASPTGWCEVTANVNKTNCQLRLTNLSEANYAYLFELEIFGKVDLSNSPLLGSFKANGTAHVGEDFEMNNDGNYEATFELASTATMISAENPITDVTAENGEIGTITYEGDNDQCKVTIPVTLNENSVNYIANFVRKPMVTLTYIDVDGQEIGKQEVEKDTKITAFAYNIADIAATKDGYKARGWFKQNSVGEKFTTESVITEAVNLYAVQTEIEEAEAGKIFSYDLTKTYFYAEDHEAFINNGGSFNDGQHGWVWGNTKSFSIPVAGNAQIVLGLCKYSAETAISVTAANGAEVEDIASGKGASDGATTTVNYSGEATTLTFTFAGTTYIHNIKVYNVESFPTKDEATGYYMVGAGDGAGLILALNSANAEATSASSIAKIFLPNGTYDVGSEISQSNPALAISKSYVSIIGESMDGVIIKGVTPAENESLKAGLLHNTAQYTYLQDLTIQNYASAYNKTTGAERANAMRDEGNYSMLKNVYLKGTQDAYLTNGAEGQKIYYEGGRIEGTVDFICGSGNVFFKEVNLYAAHSATYKAATGKEAGVYIAAPNTYASEKGYVFNGCTISGEANLAGKYFFARPWNNAAEKKPACTWINTNMELASEGTGYSKEISSATYPQLRFHELNTTDANGGAVTTHNLSACTLAIAKDDLYLTAETGYTINEVLGDFATSATQATTQLEAPNATYDNGNVTWTPANNGATAYMIEKNGKFVAITSENSYAIEIDAAKDKLTIRAANSRGGFGEAKQVAGTATGIHAINAAIERGEQVIYNIAGQRVNKATRGLYIVNGKKIIVK